MIWNQIEGQWRQRRGKVMHHWEQMTIDKVAAIAGQYDELVGRIEEKYGMVKEEA